LPISGEPRDLSVLRLKGGSEDRHLDGRGGRLFLCGSRTCRHHQGRDGKRDDAGSRGPLHAVIRSKGIDESTPMPSPLGSTPRATTALPSAAIIAPLSVQYLSGGIRTVIPRSAPRACARSRS